jgi:ribonuclease P/MRP protein subunit RPP40
MLHGKKGFERIVWAVKNVLNQSVTWLLCDPASNGTILEQGKTIECFRYLYD